MRIRIEAAEGELEAKTDAATELIRKAAERPPAELPPLWGLLYAAPNPDGTRKRCANCGMWKREEKRCSIHKPDQEVEAGDVCGYHVFGHEPLPTSETGLEKGPAGGTSCDRCKHFTSSNRCLAAVGTPSVHPKGCCARWEGRGDKLSKGDDEHCCELHKALQPRDQIDQRPRKLDYDVMATAMESAQSKDVQRIRRLMLRRINRVIDGAK